MSADGLGPGSLRAAILVPDPLSCAELTHVRGVYVVQIGMRGPYKVGYSQNIPVRIEQIQLGLPQSLRYLGRIGTCRSDERVHLRALGKWKLRGEWFRCVTGARRYLRNAIARGYP